MTRFFELPELVAHVAHHLDHKSISRLMRTSRQLHSFCTPALYYNVYANFRPMRKNLFASKESIGAFARNVDLVRDLDMNLMDMPSALLLPLVDGVFTGAHEAQQEERMRLSRRPQWLAPPDPQIRTLSPIPPMTLLTKLDLHLGFPTPPSSSDDRCPYSLPSSKDPRATLTQTCWLLDSNPHLLDLRLTSLVIKGRRDIRLLSRAVFGLKRLQEMKFETTTWSRDGAGKYLKATQGLAFAMFFACSPTLRRFYLEVKAEDTDLWKEVTEEYRRIGQEQPLSWEMTEDDDHDEVGDDGDGDESRGELA
ncbi:hypothetical protein BGZ90_002489, partial [Linnemannia elongata]